MLTIVTCPVCKKKVPLIEETIPRADHVRHEFYGKHTGVESAVCEASFADYHENDTAATVRFKRKDQ
jgi:uncharacterized protein YbaR (Trm112 family)